MNLVSVFLGGGLGALMRFFMNSIIFKQTNLPFATFFVNVAGSFLIGFLYVFFVNKSDINPALKLALTVGFCGGLTTFSTFSFEVFEMLSNNQFLYAFVYIILSIIICVIAVSIGVCCAKII